MTDISKFVRLRADGKLVRPDGSVRDNTLAATEGTYHAIIRNNSVDVYAGSLPGPNGPGVAWEWEAPNALAIGPSSLVYNGGKDATIKYSGNDVQQIRTISLTVTDGQRGRRKYTRTFLPTPSIHFNKSENRIHYTGKGNETVTHSINFTPQFTGTVVIEWQQVGGSKVAAGAPKSVAVTSGTQVTDTLSYTVPAVTSRATWTWVPVVYMGHDGHKVLWEDHSYTAVPAVASVASQNLSVMDSKRPAWTQRDVRTAPLATTTDYAGAPSQADIQTYFKAELTANGVVVNTQQYTASTFVVDSSTTPKYKIEFFDKWGWRYIPGEWYTAGGRQIGLNLPIPDEAVWAAGTDQHMMIVDPIADKVWESWLTYTDRNNAWKAANLGRLDSYTTSLGKYINQEGVTAAKLSWLPIMLTIAECQAALADLKARGRAAWLADANAVRVKHCIYMATLSPRAGKVSWPAGQTDGNSSNNAAPWEGQTMRLDPALNLSTLTTLNDLGLIITRALQEYGAMISDKAGSVNLGCQSGLPEQRRTGADPWVAMLEGAADWQLLKAIPATAWQAVKVDWGKP